MFKQSFRKSKLNSHRFWQTKVHEGDRRGTKSQIEIGSDGDSVKDHADVAKASSEDSASKVMIHKCRMYIRPVNKNLFLE